MNDYPFLVNDRKEPMLNINVGSQVLDMLVDSGASCNIIGVQTWEKMKDREIQCTFKANSNRKLYAYGSNQPLPVKGTFNCDVKCGNNTTKAEFVVVNSNGVPLLGKQTEMEMGVLKIGQMWLLSMRKARRSRRTTHNSSKELENSKRTK